MRIPIKYHRSTFLQPSFVPLVLLSWMFKFSWVQVRYLPRENDLAVRARGGRPLAAIDGPQLFAEPCCLLVALPPHRVKRRDLQGMAHNKVCIVNKFKLTSQHWEVRSSEVPLILPSDVTYKVRRAVSEVWTAGDRGLVYVHRIRILEAGVPRGE